MTAKRYGDIVKQVKLYTAAGGELEPGQRFGPFTCGGKCRVRHAYARAIEYTAPWPFSQKYPEPIHALLFDRPCTDSEEAKLKSGGPSW